MEEEHKNLIQRNYCNLVELVDINRLTPKLIEKGVFTFDMLEPVSRKTETDQKRHIFLAIQRRGPRAFQNLVDSLNELGDQHELLASLLQNKEYIKSAKNEPSVIEEMKVNNGVSGTRPFVLPQQQRPQHIRQISLEAPHNSYINLRSEPVKIKVKAAKEFLDVTANNKVPTYRTRSKPRGVYLCINNVEFVNDTADYRHGAEVDEQNMKKLFQEMGFRADVYRNQTLMDMERIIREFADGDKNQLLKKADCLVVAIMSHGQEGFTKEDSLVITQDYKKMPVSWIIEQFDNVHCPAFQAKPKIFIFQICRGDKVQVGVQYVPNGGYVQDDGIHRGRIRNMTDILVAYSTLPGDKAYRDMNLGTWFIRAICQVFMEHACDTDVESMLKMVDERISHLRTGDGFMQTSCYENKAFKRCFLHPKLYEE